MCGFFSFCWAKRKKHDQTENTLGFEDFCVSVWNSIEKRNRRGWLYLFYFICVLCLHSANLKTSLHSKLYSERIIVWECHSRTVSVETSDPCYSQTVTVTHHPASTPSQPSTKSDRQRHWKPNPPPSERNNSTSNQVRLEETMKTRLALTVKGSFSVYCIFPIKFPPALDLLRYSKKFTFITAVVARFSGFWA